jgi:hypothetical protein
VRPKACALKRSVVAAGDGPLRFSSLNHHARLDSHIDKLAVISFQPALLRRPHAGPDTRALPFDGHRLFVDTGGGFRVSYRRQRWRRFEPVWPRLVLPAGSGQYELFFSVSRRNRFGSRPMGGRSRRATTTICRISSPVKKVGVPSERFEADVNMGNWRWPRTERCI